MNNVLKKIIYIFSFIIFIGIFLLLVISSRNKNILLVSVPLFIVLSMLFNRIKINTKLFTILLFCFSFAIRFVILLYLKIEPYSDFAVLLNASTDLSEGINVMNDSTYFQTWAYQTGFVLYQALILKVFNSVLMLHILDCLFTSAICVLIYKISTLIFNKPNKLPTILYLLYIYAICYTGVLTNQHIFTFLSLVSIFIILKETKIDKLKYLIVGFILGIANILRPEGITILIAIVGYKILTIKDKKQIKSVLKNLIILFITYISIIQLSSLLIKVSNINQYGLTNNNPLWKFVCGSDYTTGGQYSLRGEQIMSDPDKEKDFIITNYKSLDLKSALTFAKRKVENFWLTDEYSWVFMGLDNQSKFLKMSIIYDSIIYTFILTCVIFSIGNKMLQTEKNNKNLLLILILLINFGIYLLIEVQPRYSYTAKIILFILACDGTEQIINFGEFIIEKCKTKILNNKSQGEIS